MMNSQDETRVNDDAKKVAGGQRVSSRISGRVEFIQSLRSRLLLLVALAVVPLLALILWTGVEQRQMAADQAQADALRIAGRVASNYEYLIESTQEVLLKLSRMPEVHSGDSSACSARLAQILKEDARYANFGVATPGGMVVSSALPIDKPISAAERTWFRRAVATRAFAVGDYQIGRITGRRTINFGYPVFDDDGRLQVVVFCALNVEYLNRLMDNAHLPEGSVLNLIDESGTVLARRPDPDKLVGKTLSEEPIVHAMLSRRDEGTIRANGLDGADRLYAFMPVRQMREAPNVYVSVGIPARVAFATADRIMTRNLALGSLSGLLVMLLARIACEIFLRRRIDPLLVATQKLAAGDLSVRTGVTTGPAELTQLARAFDQLAESLQHREAERECVERALRESEERFRLLSACSPVGIFLADIEGQCVYTNPRCRAIMGGSLMETLGDGWMRFLHPDDRAWVVKEWAACVHNRREFCYEFRFQTVLGVVRWVSARASTMLSEKSDLRGFVETLEDITARKEAEEALRQAEAKYRALVEQLPAITYIAEFGSYGQWHYVSPQIEKILGYSAAEWMSQSALWVQQLHPDDRARVLGEEILTHDTHGTFAVEYRMLARDGREVWFRDEARVMAQSEGQPPLMQGIMLDITERKHLEEQLRQSQKMEAVGRLAGGVAHDFNNVLTAITGYSELILRRIARNDPLRHSVEEINKAGTRAAALTRQLLAFSRKQVLQPKVLDLNALVVDVEKMLRRLIGEDIDLELKLQPERGCVKADPGQIEQVILNLVVNARDAMPNGGRLTIETANVVLDKDAARLSPDFVPGQYVTLAVSDTGTGMTEDVKAHIFEPFFTTKPEGKGTGLGLATCYGIVKQSGGHIEVDSEPGVGTTFRISLPRVHATPRPAAPPEESGQMPRGSESVLLVEDESAVRELNSCVLRDLGYTVLEATNGDEALRVAQQRAESPIDLLLTDVVMPQMGGKELAEKLRAISPETKVLFTSGYTEDAISQHGPLDPAVAFLQKPFRPNRLARKVRDVLDGRTDELN